MQGSIYALQIISASSVDIAEFSRIRTIESAAAVLALAITFGLPSTLLVHARRSVEAEELSLTGAASFLSLLTTMLATTILLVTGVWWLFPMDQIDWTYVAALPLSFLMACRLIFSTMGQAQQRFVELSKVSAVACFISIGSFDIAIFFGRADMWIWFASRVLLELIIIMGMWNFSFGSEGFHFRSWRTTILRACLLLRSALPLGGSLFLRSLLDQGPVLLAMVITAEATVAAEVGLILTVCTIALVPALTAQGVWVPRLVEAAFTGSIPYKGIFAYLVIGAFSTALIACVLLMAIPFLVSWVDVPNSDWLVPVAIIVAAKMTAGAIGGVLLALQRNRIIFIINTTTASLGVVAALVLFTTRDLPSTENFLIAIALVEFSGAALYIAALLFRYRTQLPPPPS